MAGIDFSGAIRSPAGIGLPGVVAQGARRVGLGHVCRVSACNGLGGFDRRIARAFGYRDLRDCFQSSGLDGLRDFPLPVEEPAGLKLYGMLS